MILYPSYPSNLAHTNHIYNNSYNIGLCVRTCIRHYDHCARDIAVYIGRNAPPLLVSLTLVFAV